MGLGFIESKVDSKIYFKVEGGRPVMLLLYVDVLFLTEKVELNKVARRRLFAEFEMKNLGMVLSRHGGVAECIWNLPGIREVCIKYPEEVGDDGLQGNHHTYGIEPEAIELCFIKVD